MECILATQVISVSVYSLTLCETKILCHCQQIECPRIVMRFDCFVAKTEASQAEHDSLFNQRFPADAVTHRSFCRRMHKREREHDVLCEPASIFELRGRSGEIARTKRRL